MRTLIESMFYFDLNMVRGKVKQVIKEQKFRNNTLINATNSNILATCGNSTFDKTLNARRLKLMKHVRWMEKSKLGIT